ILHFSFFIVHVAFGDVHYVDIASTNATAPYTNWATAATVIQDAIDEAEEGDRVLVNDGTYDTGGRAVHNDFTNRIAITNVISVESVNGPDLTLIVGQGPIGGNAVRCAYVCSNAHLCGFTLTNGCTRDAGDGLVEQSGGGVWSRDGATVSNCTLTGNSAKAYGGGAYRGTLCDSLLEANCAEFGGGVEHGTLQNCALRGNSASRGGGAMGGTSDNCSLVDNLAFWAGGGASDGLLTACTVVGNTAGSIGGGVYCSTLRNCIVYFNAAPTGANEQSSALDYCCTPLMPTGGIRNITCDPKLASGSHLSVNSPCLAAGNPAYAAGTDIDGEPWRSVPAMGCDEVHSGAVTGALTVTARADFTNVCPGLTVSFVAEIDGRTTDSQWDFGGGIVESNRPLTEHTWDATGDQAVVLTAWNESWPAGVSATVTVHVVEAPVHYVACDSAAPAAPYSSWASAATRIQDAVDAASVAGATILVSNGVYDAGGRAGHPEGTVLTNRVAVCKPLTLRSVGGPNVTVIDGRGPAGAGAIRCVYLAQHACLIGFTVTNGVTLDQTGSRDGEGGGVWCSDCSAEVSNCVISGNSAYGGGASYGGTLAGCDLTGNSATDGGGAFGGILTDCTLIGNWALMEGGGSFGGVLTECTLSQNATAMEGGGGAAGSRLVACVLTDNQAAFGGGAAYATLSRCVVTGNWAYSGGGVYGGTLDNCLLVRNSAQVGGGSHESVLSACTLAENSADLAGGAFGGNLYDCIAYFNDAPASENWTNASLSYCCTTPLPTGGVGNITGDPLFADTNAADYRLLLNSPCVDAGGNQDGMEGVADLDGNPRILNGTVDMGAYELPFWVSARAFLQGTYDTNMHNMNALLGSNAIPVSAPYASDHRTASAMPACTVDWLQMELWGTNGQVAFSRSAWVNGDGFLLNDDAATNVLVDVAARGGYGLVFKHRNHLGVLSAEPLVFTNQLLSYDFTTSSTCYYGGTNACVELEPGVWGMIAGDADGDGKITWVDRAIASNQVGRSGYWCGDADLNGDVDE
ncbi:MAG: hypothetical protein JXR37_18630, partial [Kiritimatiellae bacterium]|nr:hypothetical protein [Kiritimatiellia bacterium]